MPFQDLLSSLFGLNDPYKQDRDALEAQILQMTDPYRADRERLAAQIEEMTNPKKELILGGERKLTGYTPDSGVAPQGQPRGDDFWSRTKLTPETVRGAAQAKIQERELGEQEEIAREAAHEAEKQRLLEAAGIKNEQQEYMRGTIPLIEDYDKRIAVGGQPGRGSAEDIMFRIRAEAKAKGRGGSLRGGTPTEQDYMDSVTPTGGGLTFAPDSPQIQQRLAERDAWLAEQPMRDAAFALSPQQIRRNPEGAGGAEYLRRIGQDQMETVRRERASQLIQQFIGPSGKIPADAARKLATMDPIFANMIPPDAIGMSREQATEMIDAELMSAQQIAMSSAGNMEDMAKPIKMELVNRVYPLAEAAKKRIAMGEDPEIVMQDYRSKVAAINYQIMQSPVFQQLIGPAQTIAGE
jgi:hypothetical protein